MRHDAFPVSVNRWLIAAAIAVLLGLSGFATHQNLATAGYTAGRDGTITSVADEGPAARAGLAEGDRILAIEGTAYESTVARFRQGRPAIGDSRRFEIERGAERFDLLVTVDRIAGSTLATFVAAALVGLVFLIAGLASHLRARTGTSRLAALIGLAAVPAFGLIPYLPNTELRMLMTVLLGMAGVAILPMLVELILRFPGGPPPRRAVRLALYLPVLVIGLGLALTLFAFPALLTPVNTLSAAFPAVLVVIALLAAVVRWRRSEPGPYRRVRGILLLSLVLGLAPLVVGLVASSLPGAGTYFLSVVLIPLAIAHGFHRSAGLRPRATVQPVEV